jgi:hypothetical protein
MLLVGRSQQLCRLRALLLLLLLLVVLMMLRCLLLNSMHSSLRVCVGSLLGPRQY